MLFNGPSISDIKMPSRIDKKRGGGHWLKRAYRAGSHSTFRKEETKSDIWSMHIKGHASRKIQCSP